MNNDNKKELINRLKIISEFAFDDNDALLSIKEQKEYQDKAKSWLGDDFMYKPFIVALSTKDLNIPEFKERPLLLTRKTLKHIWSRHANDFTFNQLIDTIQNINKELSNNVLAFQEVENPNKICLVLDRLSRENNHLLCIILSDSKSSNINLNKITSLYGKKELFDKIQKSIDAGRNIYTNKKTGNWLAQTEIGIFNGNNARSATKQYLLDLYNKQNFNKCQESNSCKTKITNSIQPDKQPSKNSTTREER